jgi:hypothetical protein
MATVSREGQGAGQVAGGNSVGKFRLVAFFGVVLVPSSRHSLIRWGQQVPARLTSVIDVHAPHNAVHGWRDFFIHIITITIGLLIALGLEGCVEWMHHRHLVHEAEQSLHAEIHDNSAEITNAVADLHQRQAELKNDVTVLKYLIKNKKMPEHASMSIGFHISTLDDVSWKTAQSTGALSYMPYAQAQDYSDIYSTQNELYASEQQAARDAIISLAPFMDENKDDPDPTPAEATEMKQKIEVLQGQLMLVENLMLSLDKSYKKYLEAHPA